VNKAAMTSFQKELCQAESLNLLQPEAQLRELKISSNSALKELLKMNENCLGWFF